MTKPAPLTVFYDGACPLCLREIAYYRQRTPLRPIRWMDVSTEDPEDSGTALSQCDAMRRFHVMDTDGALKSGAAAFAVLWQHYPGWRIFGHIVALPGIHYGAEMMYRLFLLIRPAVQAAVRAAVNRRDRTQ